ncbi:MAG: 6,7-dimethyl-8-ribityllumazine synthase [Kiritimatiellae bacterium]|nr:6,7-dimethyl-8-ribityllumazine synthase [Kiritimatiellia bacterium]MBP5227328.1 6,7-dimethyl-8-ribityllumazine synthase [Kiritimatiellia bacterium]
MREITGALSAKGIRLAVVVSRFNSFLTEQLVKGAEDCFLRHGGDAEALDLVRVPGANEIPVVADKLAATGKYQAVIALGAVIQGATPHADLINGTVARALSQIALRHGIPVLNGVIAAQDLQQAIERAGTKQGNKGWDAVMAALETVAVLSAI